MLSKAAPSILLVVVLILSAAPAGASHHHGIDPLFRIDNGSARPAKAFEAFDAVTMAAVDLTGDGVKEIMAHNDNNRFYVFDGRSGRLLAELQTNIPPGWGAREIAGPAVGDLTGNGLKDIVLTNSAGWVTAFEAQPVEDDRKVVFHKLWETYLDPHRYDPDYSNKMPYGEWHGVPGMDGPAFLADTNGDGRDEVFVQLDDVPALYKLAPDGRVVWHEWVSDGNSGPIVADLTGDGRLEVIYPSDGGQLWIYDAATMRHRCTFHAQGHGAWPASISVSPTVADITGDGRQEIVFGVRNVVHDRDDPDWIHRSHAHFFAVNADCHAVWHLTPDWANPHVHMHPVVMDITGNGVLDVVFQDWNTVGHKPGSWQHTGNANLFAVDGRNGNMLWRVETPNYWSNKNVVAADVTGDGHVEIVANEVRFGDGIGLFTPQGHRKGFVSAPNGWVVTKGALVDDITGDGRLEVVLPVHRTANHCTRSLDVGCRAGALQVYRTPSGAQPVYSNNHVLNAQVQGTEPSQPTPQPPPNTSDPTFAGVQGNEWWIQVEVRAGRPVTAVDVRIDGGSWRGMTHADWGAWTHSTHVPSGKVLQFRATTDDGNTATSDCYRWTAAERVDCPGSSAPPPGEPGTFGGVRGNTWWVEVEVQANGVDLRVNGGQWAAMARTDWGTWARSQHVPEGSIVQFRTAAGATSDCYHWTSAEPTSCPGGSAPPPGEPGTFGGVRGNTWWVEVEVQASGVDLRIDGSPWAAMARTDWGTWARSLHVPEGSVVQFRTSAGATSDCYRWTSAERTACPDGGDSGGGDGGDDGGGDGGFASFTGARGNMWWVEVEVQTDRGLRGVDARPQGGDWRPLELKDWGSWARSMHVPDGTKVEFRAVATDGTTAHSETFTWPPG